MMRAICPDCGRDTNATFGYSTGEAVHPLECLCGWSGERSECTDAGLVLADAGGCSDPPRPRGRPPVADKRKPRGGFNDAEWAEVKVQAAEWGVCPTCRGTVPPDVRSCCGVSSVPMTASAYLRMRVGL